MLCGGFGPLTCIDFPASHVHVPVTPSVDVQVTVGVSVVLQ